MEKDITELLLLRGDDLSIKAADTISAVRKMNENQLVILRQLEGEVAYFISQQPEIEFHPDFDDTEESP